MRINASWIAPSVLVLSVGLLLVATLEESIFSEGQRSVVPKRSEPSGMSVSAELHPSFIDATDNIIGTIGPAHYRGGSAADTDAVGAACTATGADRGGVVSTRTCATPSAVGGYITGRASLDVVGSACAASGRDSGNAAGAGVSIACGTTGATGNRDGGAVGQRLRADATRTADAGHSVCRAAAGG